VKIQLKVKHGMFYFNIRPSRPLLQPSLAPCAALDLKPDEMFCFNFWPTRLSLQLSLTRSIGRGIESE